MTGEMFARFIDEDRPDVGDIGGAAAALESVSGAR